VTSSVRSVLGVAVGVVLLAACGADDSGPALSEAAAAGRSIYISNGCAACHGSDGGGGVGPSLVSLIGSTSEFADGTSLVAVRAYVVESIMDPAARKVAGYSIPMPMNNLSLSDVESITDFIAELGLP
jgi:mono/diheme cytochrome c family protein